MDAYMPMSTTRRHNRMLNEFVIKLTDMAGFEKMDFFTSECALVHWGQKRKSGEQCSLVDVSELDDIDDFKETTINHLECVQPDFMLFKDNPSVANIFETLTAGCPDLVIEVWSKGNTRSEKDFKKALYSTSGRTEHWYMEQDSNVVACFFGKEALPEQSLLNVLRTVNGMELDLRRMAI